MNKNLITGLGVLAVAGVAYYFWRRSQLVLAKEKADSNKSVDKSVDATNVITTTTTTKSEFYGQKSEEEPIISNINTYPYGRYNSVNIMVDEANY